MQAGDGKFHGGDGVHPLGELRDSPCEHDQAQDQPGLPRLEDFSGAVIEALPLVPGNVLAFGVEHAFGLPEAQEHNEHNDGGGGGDDVG